MGKVKIDIKKIENPNARQVCFSKRRMGIFKKASELAILCGVETAIIVFSPAGKPFSFGSPDVDFVVDKYQKIPVHVDDEKVQRAQRSEQQYNSILRELDVEKKHTEKLKRWERNKDVDLWLTRDIDNLQLPELIEFHNTLKTFQERIIQIAEEKKSRNSLADKEPNKMEAAQMPQESCYFQCEGAESTIQASSSVASTSGVQYQPTSWDDDGAFNTLGSWSAQELYQPMLGSFLNGSSDARDCDTIQYNPTQHQGNAAMQDGNATVKWPFVTNQSPIFPHASMPFHLLMPDEGYLPPSTELPDLQKVVMPDKQNFICGADAVGIDNHVHSSLNIKDYEFGELGYWVENTFMADYGQSNEQ